MVSRPTLGPFAFGVELMGGTSTAAAPVAGLALVRPGFAWGGNESGLVGGRPGTLLGPEGTAVQRLLSLGVAPGWGWLPAGPSGLDEPLLGVGRFGGRCLGVGAGWGGVRS